jgi:hypothetical protein
VSSDPLQNCTDVSPPPILPPEVVRTAVTPLFLVRVLREIAVAVVAVKMQRRSAHHSQLLSSTF